MPHPFRALARRVFYGWVVVGAAFLCMFVSFGVAYSFGSYFEALRDEFGASRGRCPWCSR